MIKYIFKTGAKGIADDIRQYNSLGESVKNMAGCLKSLEYNITVNSVAGQPAKVYGCINNVFCCESDTASPDLKHPEWTEYCCNFSKQSPCKIYGCRMCDTNNQYADIFQRLHRLQNQRKNFWKQKFENVK